MCLDFYFSNQMHIFVFLTDVEAQYYPIRCAVFHQFYVYCSVKQISIICVSNAKE